jgi:hypothetical protein
MDKKMKDSFSSKLGARKNIDTDMQLAGEEEKGGSDYDEESKSPNIRADYSSDKRDARNQQVRS